MITVQKAKSLVKVWLKANGFDNRVTGKTVSFQDLARTDKIFVTVHGWTPNDRWVDLLVLAHGYNFCVGAVLWNENTVRGEAK
jgi:hypothetical protein